MNALHVVNKHHLTQTTHRHIYIGRPSVLGNPFPINEACTREQAVAQYELWLLEQIFNHNQKVIHELERIAALVSDGTGKPVYLVCYCSPKLCHGDIIKKCIENALSQAT